MTERLGATSYPLYWPAGWKRTKRPQRARFGDTNVYRETQSVRAELERMGARQVVVSSNLQLRQDGIPYANQRMPDDRGVAVWFWLPKPGVGRLTPVHPDRWTEHVLACDRWDRPEHNLRAIAKHIEALRGQERWGVGSLAQAFRGYKALPSGESRPWHVVLGCSPGADLDEIQRAYRRKALDHHPDRGGDSAAWHELQVAFEAARKERG